MNVFEFHDANPRFNRLFNKGLSDCSSITMKKILEIYKGFEGVGSLVDVGGGTGAVISMIASKYSSMKCLNFDLPHVIKEAPPYAGSFMGTGLIKYIVTSCYAFFYVDLDFVLINIG